MEELFICIFAGWFGLHKFVEGKYAMGILYLFTFGLFGVGWTIDIIFYIAKLIKNKKINNSECKSNNDIVNKIDSCNKNVSVKAEKIEINSNQMLNSFIAFDLETTGLIAGFDKIIEVGFVKFLNGEIIDSYSSLVKCDKHISESASRINNITDEMLAKYGREPIEVYNEASLFLQDAIEGKIPLVAHNASFDIGFLLKAFEEYGHECNLKYIDTLSLSRKYISNLANHKLDTVARFFNIVNHDEHRACSDAETCGKILINILDKANVSNEQKSDTNSNTLLYKLDDISREICAIILKILEDSKVDISKIRFYKNSLNYIDVIWIYPVMKLKISKKGLYLIMPKEYINDYDFEIKECTQSEGGDQNVRVYFENIFDIKLIAKNLIRYFEDFCHDNIQNDLSLKKYEIEFLKNANFDYIRREEIDQLIENARIREDKKQEMIEKSKLEKEIFNKEKEEIKRQKELKKQETREEKEKIKKERYDSMIALQQEELKNSENYTLDKIICICNNAKVLGKRAIIKMDDNGNIIKVYASVTSACEEIKLDSKTIRDAANKKCKHAGGFCWKYADEYIENVKNNSNIYSV